MLKKQNKTEKYQPFFFGLVFFFLAFLDKSRRQILLRPGHHHGEHTSREPVTAALPGVCKGKSLFHVFSFNSCFFQQCGMMLFIDFFF